MTSRPVIVNVSESEDPAWNWIGGRFPEDPFRWISFSGRPSSAFEKRIQSPKISRYRTCWEAARAAKRERAALIVSHTPLVSAWMNLFCRAMGVKAPHLAFSFTFSKLPTGLRRRFIVDSLRGIDRFVCFSSVERARYPEYFGIPAGRIDSLRWSAAEPGFDSSATPIEPTPYLCAVGGEGRDYVTLVEAMRRLPDHHLAIVTRPANVKGLDLPSNVSVRTNIPLADVWNLIAHAKLMVLPLHDTQVPCGHGTLIAAMQLETPSIVTESVAMTDYVSDEATGLICPPGDPDAMARTIERLWKDEALARRLERNARAFVTQECSERRIVSDFTDYVRSLGLL
ncbi:MAG: glycosyltransferase family 4 protein [Myxococcales bacterium]|nr:glycosyltransferase family 4 protein [Myxococcales bacterium]